MPTVHLTETFCRDVVPGPARVDYLDDVTTGLSLRVAPSGRKTWSYLYRPAAGRVLRRLTLGRWPDLTLGKARIAARDAVSVRATGKDPAASRQDARDALTFAALADAYLERYAKVRKRSWRQDARQLRVFCRPRWPHVAAVDVSRVMVRDLLTDVSTTRSPVIANRLRACLHKLFAWALAQGYVEQNPVAGLPATAPESARERVLGDAEIVTFWRAIAAAEGKWTAATEAGRTPPPDALSPTLALWMRLRLLTGARGGELANLTWRDVDVERACYEVPASSYKTKRAHVVPLSPWALDLLTARRRERPYDDYVLEGGRGRAARSGVGPAFPMLDDFRPHDLRRTVATNLSKLGVSRHVVAAVLGHADHSVTGIYDRYDLLDEKRAALVKWSERLADVLDVPAYQAPRKVIPIGVRA